MELFPTYLVSSLKEGVKYINLTTSQENHYSNGIKSVSQSGDDIFLWYQEIVIISSDTGSQRD